MNSWYENGQKKYEGILKSGELVLLNVPEGQYNCIIEPEYNVDVGFGKGVEYKGNVYGGEVGIILDGRGRSIVFSKDNKVRIDQILNWSNETRDEQHYQ